MTVTNSLVDSTNVDFVLECCIVAYETMTVTDSLVDSTNGDFVLECCVVAYKNNALEEGDTPCRLMIANWMSLYVNVIVFFICSYFHYSNPLVCANMNWADHAH